MSTFSSQALLEKLSRLTLSQESIETLSLWIIHHKVNAKAAIDIWLQELDKGIAVAIMVGSKRDHFVVRV